MLFLPSNVPTGDPIGRVIKCEISDGTRSLVGKEWDAFPPSGRISERNLHHYEYYFDPLFRVDYNNHLF
jgi:hypothetical protein